MTSTRRRWRRESSTPSTSGFCSRFPTSCRCPSARRGVRRHQPLPGLPAPRPPVSGPSPHRSTSEPVRPDPMVRPHTCGANGHPRAFAAPKSRKALAALGRDVHLVTCRAARSRRSASLGRKRGSREVFASFGASPSSVGLVTANPLDASVTSPRSRSRPAPARPTAGWPLAAYLTAPHWVAAAQSARSRCSRTSGPAVPSRSRDLRRPGVTFKSASSCRHLGRRPRPWRHLAGTGHGREVRRGHPRLERDRRQRRPTRAIALRRDGPRAVFAVPKARRS